jgi:hypothetical protein
MQAAKIEWYDAFIVSNDWVSVDSLKDVSLPLQTTYGFIVKDEAEFICVAQSKGRSHVQGVICIPHGMIKQITVL